MSKTFLRSLSASTLLLVGYHILMPYPVLHAARTVQTVGLQQTSDEFLKKWLEQDVVYIIADEEKASFKRLATDDERYQFIESFWLRRSTNPDLNQELELEFQQNRSAKADLQLFAQSVRKFLLSRGNIKARGEPDPKDETEP